MYDLVQSNKSQDPGKGLQHKGGIIVVWADSGPNVLLCVIYGVG